jgi:hypothetical protein
LLIAVQKDGLFDDRDLERLKAIWPGQVFEFSPKWISVVDPAGTPEWAGLVRTLCVLGGRSQEISLSEMREISMMKLLVWAKTASRDIVASAAVGFGDFVSRTKISKFRGSNEGSTALALKALIASWLKRTQPSATISFEEVKEGSAIEGAEPETRRVDLFSKGLGVFEVETMHGSGPIEDFYQRKVFSRANYTDGTFHLVVPNEALLWAGPYLTDIAFRLGGKGKVLFPVVRTKDETGVELALAPLGGVPLERRSIILMIQ